MVDGVDNKANGRFWRLSVWEWLSLVVFLASIRCSVWAIRVRMRALQGSRAALGDLLVVTVEERLNHASRETTNANE
jgi:hypothetical protein